jgi:predicted transcriptional regulator
MGDNGDGRELFELFSDRRTVRILHETDQEPRSVKELADACDVSGPTLYRHVNTLVEKNLLQQETNIDTDGNHYTVYKNNIRNATVTITPATDDIRVELTYRDSVEQFKRLWEDIRHDS